MIVHGFNLTFRNSLLHGAQIAMDSQWRCATLLLNWSSEGMFNRYAADIERSGYAVPLLIELLRALNAAGVTPDILGHSMGARIVLCDPHRAIVSGPTQLRGSTVESPDIRAGMAMLLAALCADGTSVINNAQQIERGYERIESRLGALGARIRRVELSAR